MSFKYVCGGALGVQPKTKTKNNMLLQTIIMEQENDSEHMKHLELKAPGTQQVRVKELVFLDDDSGVANCRSSRTLGASNGNQVHPAESGANSNAARHANLHYAQRGAWSSRYTSAAAT